MTKMEIETNDPNLINKINELIKAADDSYEEEIKSNFIEASEETRSMVEKARTGHKKVLKYLENSSKVPHNEEYDAWLLERFKKLTTEEKEMVLRNDHEKTDHELLLAKNEFFKELKAFVWREKSNVKSFLNMLLNEKKHTQKGGKVQPVTFDVLGFKITIQS